MSRADHIDRHGTLEHYAAVKERLVAGVPTGGTAIVGVDDSIARRHGRPARARRQDRSCGFRFAGRCATVSIVGRRQDRSARRAAGSDDREAPGDRIVARGPQRAERGLRGGRRCWRWDSKPRRFRQGLRSFSRACAPHGGGRAQGHACFSSTIRRRPTPIPPRARSRVSTDIYWIAGGKPKTGGIRSLAEFFPRIRKAYLIGEAAADFAATLDGKVTHEIAGTLDKAVAAAARDAQASSVKEPVVLLSPACASFDQFREFRGARGRVPGTGARAAESAVIASESSQMLIAS